MYGDRQWILELDFTACVRAIEVWKFIGHIPALSPLPFPPTYISLQNEWNESNFQR